MASGEIRKLPQTERGRSPLAVRRTKSAIETLGKEKLFA
jgi:hypothetical protein